MDPDSARHILREQNRKAHGKMHLQLAELACQAEAAASALVPFLDQAWVLADTSVELPGHGWTGRLTPEAHRALSDACVVADEAGRRMLDLARGLKNFDSYEQHWRVTYGTVRSHISPLVQAELNNPGSVTTIVLQKAAEHAMYSTHSLLLGSAQYFREVAIPERLIDIPEDIHPPRHGRLKEGVLARIVSEDLAVQIRACRDLEASLAARPGTWLTLADWLSGIRELLGDLADNIGQNCLQLISGVIACGNSVIDDPDALAQAYVALARSYFEELKDRMTDYAEASGQKSPESQVSMNFSGGTFYGGQFAGQIKNIDSTIAGIAQSGDSEVAHALRALEQAVLAQHELDAERRRDLLDNIEYLAQAAQSPPERRNRGIIKSSLAALTAAAATGTELSKAVDAWGSILHRLIS